MFPFYTLLGFYCRVSSLSSPFGRLTHYNPLVLYLHTVWETTVCKCNVLQSQYWNRFVQLEHQDIAGTGVQNISVFQVNRCRDLQNKLSLLSQHLRALLTVCNVYSRRLERSLGRQKPESLEVINHRNFLTLSI